MKITAIEKTVRQYLENGEIAGGILIVRRKDHLLYKGKWGYADIASCRPAEYGDIWRMMTMTKPVTAVAVMQLAEAGKLDIDRPVSDWLPAFAHPRVAADERYGEDWAKLEQYRDGFTPEGVKTVPASRPFTARDLLTHSAGLEEGTVVLLCGAFRGERMTLADVVDHYARWPLDFEPGARTAYSPQAGFDVLARLVEIVSGEDADSYFKKHIFEPLEMEGARFFPTEEVFRRVVTLYERRNGVLTDVTAEAEVYGHIAPKGSSYTAGGAGLYSTAEDYDRFAHMLAAEGERRGARILKAETVRMMREEALLRKSGGAAVWGLGMMIRERPGEMGSACPPGAYGWSGAFGTHFVIDPSDGTSFVWVTNRTDLNGSGSYISAKMEELVFGN